MKKVYEGREISRDTKVTVFEVVAIPTLMYGCELWYLTERETTFWHAIKLECDD